MQITQTRNGFTPSASSNATQSLFPNVRSAGTLGGKSRNTISSHQLMQAAKNRPRPDKVYIADVQDDQCI